MKINNNDTLLLFRQFAVIECRHRHEAFSAEKSWFFTVFPGFFPPSPPPTSAACTRFQSFTAQTDDLWRGYGKLIVLFQCVYTFFFCRSRFVLFSFCSRFFASYLFPIRERDVCFCIFHVIVRSMCLCVITGIDYMKLLSYVITEYEWEKYVIIDYFRFDINQNIYLGFELYNNEVF